MKDPQIPTTTFLRFTEPVLTHNSYQFNAVFPLFTKLAEIRKTWVLFGKFRERGLFREISGSLEMAYGEWN